MNGILIVLTGTLFITKKVAKFKTKINQPEPKLRRYSHTHEAGFAAQETEIACFFFLQHKRATVYGREFCSVDTFQNNGGI